MNNFDRPPRMIEYRGQMVKLKQLAIDHGINPRTLAGRIDKGMDIETALTTPVDRSLAAKPTKANDRNLSTRNKIVNKLLDVFYKNPKRFEQWIEDEMAADPSKFFKTFIMPFLAKDQHKASDSTKEKAVIAIEFNSGNSSKPSLAIDGKVIDA